MNLKLSHLDEQGRASMVDITPKPPLIRKAKAEGLMTLKPETVQLITAGKIPKGDVWNTARIAAIMAVKRTDELIPLCHSLSLTHIGVDFMIFDETRIKVVCEVSCIGSTGVEMEALTGVTTALLTIYDMCKAVDKSMQMEEIKLCEKTKEPLI